MADVYGGSGWYQLALQAASEAAARALQESQLMGWQVKPAQKPTRAQALAAIWQAIPTAQRPKGNPEQSAEKWLKQNNITVDPIQYATSQGYIQDQAEQRLPTLEREQWLANLQQQQQQFGEQTQQGREQLGLQYMQLLSSLKGPENWLQYWNATRAGQNSELPMWATQLAMGRALPAFQGTTGNIDAANVWLRPNNPGVMPPTSAYNYGTMQNQYPLYNVNGSWQAQSAAMGPAAGAMPMQGGTVSPTDPATGQQYVPGYGNVPNPAWNPYQLGSLQYPMAQGQMAYDPTQPPRNTQSPLAYGQSPVTGVAPGGMTPFTNQQQQSTGYVAPNMIAQNLGEPPDRRTQQPGTGYVAPNMISMPMPQYTDPYAGFYWNPNTQSQGGSLTPMGQQAQNQAQVQWANNAMNQGVVQNLPNDASGVVNMDMPSTFRPQMPTFQGHKITPKMWKNLTPSEQQGLIGYLEQQQGGWGEDFMKQMQAAWPTASVRARSFWG